MWGKRKCAKMFDRMPEGQDHCELKYCWNNNIKIYVVERVFYVSRECGNQTDSEWVPKACNFDCGNGHTVALQSTDF